MELLNFIPEAFINFFLVLIFSLLIGLEQQRHHINENETGIYVLIALLLLSAYLLNYYRTEKSLYYLVEKSFRRGVYHTGQIYRVFRHYTSTTS